MIPDVASIVRKRYRMRKTLRFGALVLAMIFLISLAWWAIGGLVEGWASALESWRLPVFQSAFLVGAGALVLLERPLVAWLVPWSRSVCPRCGYNLAAPVPRRCPECGLELPEEYRREVAPAPPE